MLPDVLNALLAFSHIVLSLWKSVSHPLSTLSRLSFSCGRTLVWVEFESCVELVSSVELLGTL